MRNTFVLFLLFPLALLSCEPRKSSPVLFFNKALQDSLEQYISQVQDIENPYGAPTIIDIWINITSDWSEGEKDTLIAMAALYQIGGPPGHAESFDGPIISYPCDIIGAGKIKGRMCVIKYIDNNVFPYLVNESILTIPREEYDFFYQYDGPLWDVRISRSSRLYKLNGKDAVCLLEKDVGDFELK